MTVNLTLNEITAEGAMEVLKLIQKNIAEPSMKLEPKKESSAISTAPVASTVMPLQTVPTNAVVPTATPMPMPVPTTVPTSVPTATPNSVPVQPSNAPNYTIEQLQTAIAPLLDAGKVAQIQALVQSFGVATLMDIPPARYGEFANGLRNLGGVL
ncbi:MAG: hypothetical protein SOT80_08000 [Candidatus Pseudoruminococcus sp.]|nr:hypothetical protein [Ruminococcus sp.]MDY2783319.1 hypothetical protein [Candidatus Pseudoruminococcus sp.]